MPYADDRRTYVQARQERDVYAELHRIGPGTKDRNWTAREFFLSWNYARAQLMRKARPRYGAPGPRLAMS
jgi:hypothetical protein